jgi:hypothetical protein
MQLLIYTVALSTLCLLASIVLIQVAKHVNMAGYFAAPRRTSVDRFTSTSQWAEKSKDSTSLSHAFWKRVAETATRSARLDALVDAYKTEQRVRELYEDKGEAERRRWKRDERVRAQRLAMQHRRASVLVDEERERRKARLLRVARAKDVAARRIERDAAVHRDRVVGDAIRGQRGAKKSVRADDDRVAEQAKRSLDEFYRTYFPDKQRDEEEEEEEKGREKERQVDVDPRGESSTKPVVERMAIDPVSNIRPQTVTPHRRRSIRKRALIK